MPEKAILIVDDEAIILLALKQALLRHFDKAYQFETASSGEDGLAAIERLRAREVRTVLVISDWIMPGMKGDAFLTRVHELHPAIKLIMVSGIVGNQEIEGLSKLVKLEAFVRKPWSPGLLIEMVEAALA